jgi:hypothetical protein
MRLMSINLHSGRGGKEWVLEDAEVNKQMATAPAVTGVEVTGYEISIRIL